MTIHLPPEIENRARAAAERQGVDPAAFVVAAVEEKLQSLAHAFEKALPAPNETALKALEEIKRRQEGWPETAGEKTQHMLREARG